MDLTRLLVRILFVWILTLALLRVSGKQTVKPSDVDSFVVAVILGDMFDDVLWSEVPAAEFVVAAGTLVLVHLLVSIDAFRRGGRTWRRTAHESRTA